MVSVKEAQETIKVQNNKMSGSGWLDRVKEESTKNIINRLNEIHAGDHQHKVANEGHSHNGAIEEVYTLPAPDLQMMRTSISDVIFRHEFSITKGVTRQVYLELFFDPHFYSLEVLIENQDAYKTNYDHKNVEMEHYKGSKSIKTEFSEGTYTFMIIAKHPAGHDHIPDEFKVRYYEFQLYMAVARSLLECDEYPSRLNLFGLLGPEGKSFGQAIFYLPSIDFPPQATLVFEYKLNTKAVVDVQCVDEQGHGELLHIEFKEEGKTLEEAKKEVAAARDQQEDSVSYAAARVESNSNQGRKASIKLRNLDKSREVRDASIKIIITEENLQGSFAQRGQNLPNNIDQVARTKPKIPGLKEASFIQGSRRVMETFKVASLTPF